MHHNQAFSDWLTYSIFKMTAGTHLAMPSISSSTTHQIIPDADGDHLYRLHHPQLFPPEKVQNLLARKSEFVGNILRPCWASSRPLLLLGGSCFYRFLEAGVPLGVTLSFLIASPIDQ